MRNLNLWCCTIHFINLNLQRYTGAGLCGVRISVSWSFLWSWHSHSWVRQTYLLHSHLALALVDFSLLSLATWLASATAFAQSYPNIWVVPVNLTGLAASMTVNALVTGLIVLRIFKVFQQVKPTSNEQTLGATGGRKLYSIMSVIIESGMVLFCIQLFRLVTLKVTDASGNTSNASYYAFQFIIPVHEIINVIIRWLVMSTPYLFFYWSLCWLNKGLTPTIIVVRVSMGLSFHDEKSMLETIESLHFGRQIVSEPDHPTSESETGGINNTHTGDEDWWYWDLTKQRYPDSGEGEELKVTKP